MNLRRIVPIAAALSLAAVLSLAAACSSSASTRSSDAPGTTTAAATTVAPTTAPAATTAPSAVDSTAAASTAAPDTAPATTTAAPATTAAPVTAPPVPDGVTLRLGDQFDYLKTLLGAAGQDQDLPYAIEYATFVGGPPMLQAFQAGELDAGFIGTTPLIFAQAAGLPLTGVAAWATSERSFYGLVSAPGVTDIAGWADLAGRSVAVQRGTAGEAVLLEGLDSVGLTEADVTIVDVSQVSVTATLEGGSADAGIQTEPLTSAYLAAHADAAEVVAATELTDRTSVLIASTGALGDAGKSAALADLVTRLIKSTAYLAQHRQELADEVYVKVYGLTPERALELVEQNGATRFYGVPGDLLQPQQHLADLFLASDQIPEQLDVSASFDPRYNDLVVATQGS